MSPGLPRSLKIYIGLIGVAGLALLAYLTVQIEWSLATFGEIAVFTTLVVAAGMSPLPVAPRTKADVTTAVLFGAVLLLEPGAATLAGAVGIATYTFLIRFSGERMRLPLYKYPFNAGATALHVGMTALLFDLLSTGDGVVSAAVVPSAMAMYILNTAFVTGAVSLQTQMNPLRFWWMGTRENGLAELSLFAFGFLGAVAYEESPGTVVALFLPVGVIYISFSRLAKANLNLEDALVRLESLQGQIMGTAKLASIGAISQDLAHRIRNPLAIVLGQLETLKGRTEVESRETSNLDSAIDAAWRIQRVTQTLTPLGQQQWLRIDIDQTLNEAYMMACLGNTKKVNVQWDCHVPSPEIEGNPVLIQEALCNIFSNSLDAVAENGSITVDISRLNGSIVISISDDGTGIPDEEKSRLFEPFFSTKPNGQGLGLFAVKHILEMHHASMEVESRETVGTRVTLSLPVVQSQKDVPVGQACGDVSLGDQYSGQRPGEDVTQR